MKNSQEKDVLKAILSQKNIEDNLAKIKSEKESLNKIVGSIRDERAEVHKVENQTIDLSNCSITELDLRKSMLSKSPRKIDQEKTSEMTQEQNKMSILKKQEEIQKNSIAHQNKLIINLLKAKRQMLGKLLQVKSQGGYYDAHKRVVLKQLVEFMRKENRQMEERVQRKNIDQKFVEKAQKSLLMSVVELESTKKELK